MLFRSIKISIRSVDGFITAETISKLFNVSQSNIKMLPFRYHKDYEKETEYTPEIKSSCLCSGHFPSLAMILTSTKRIKHTANLGLALQFASAILGGGMALVLMLLGNFTDISPTVIISYNLIMVVITMIVQHFQKT